MHFKNDAQKPWAMELSCYKIVEIHHDFVCISKLCAEAMELNCHRIVVVHHDCTVIVSPSQTDGQLPGRDLVSRRCFQNPNSFIPTLVSSSKKHQHLQY